MRPGATPGTPSTAFTSVQPPRSRLTQQTNHGDLRTSREKTESPVTGPHGWRQNAHPPQASLRAPTKDLHRTLEVGRSFASQTPSNSFRPCSVLAELFGPADQEANQPEAADRSSDRRPSPPPEGVPSADSPSELSDPPEQEVPQGMILSLCFFRGLT